MRRDRARALRRKLTEAECRLWSQLRARRFAGSKFRRQSPLGKFIVDFVCQERRLIIELDGGQHSLQREADAARTAWLQSQGYRVLRFWNYEIMEDLDAALEVIWNAIHAES